jgi:putative hydrolase of the HAD superfamily
VVADPEADEEVKHRAVIFDLWDTLVAWPVDSAEELNARMAKCVAVASEHFYEAWVAARPEREVGPLEPSVRAMCGTLGLDGTHVDELVSMRRRHTAEVLIPIPGALRVLETLRARGYALGLISNCSEDVAWNWAATELADYVDQAILSCSVGLRKPDRRIYELAAERLRVKTSECLFVDDRPDFIEGAIAAGMDAVQLGSERAPRLEDVLELAK